MAILILVMVLTIGGCGKKAEPVEKESAATTESSVNSKVLQETEAPEVTEEPKVTQAPQVTEAPKVTAAPQATEEPRKLIIPEAPQPDENGEYDLEALFGPEQEDRSGGKGTTKYIGHNLIETEYAILDPADGVVLTQEDIELVDFVCKTMEEATELSFLDAKYYKDIKVTIHIYDSVSAGSADNFGKAIDIDKSCLHGNGLLLMVHELVHILQFTNVYTGCFPFYDEGHADYWTFKIAEYIQDNNIKGLVELVDVEREYSKWEDVYGDANAFLPIYARIPYAATGVDWDAGISGRKYMDLDPLLKMMMVTYGADVFENFYPWLREHEELFEPYKQ